MTDVTFWPTTESQFETFDQVANAALAEVGLADKYHLWMEGDGLVHCVPPYAELDDSALIDRAVDLGWDATRRLGVTRDQ